HGTLVAGVISSEDNGFGIIGVAPNASLYAVKVIDDVGYGSISDLIQGIEWCMENEIDIISMPIGGFYDSNALHDACDIAYESDILLIAAGGNRLDENPHTHEVYYPAFYDSVIAVGATDKDDVVWHKSNTGIYLELSAPGVEINSTYLKGEYAKASGTSLSCSHVSGVAALALATDPTMSNEEVRKWLKVTSLDLGEKGRDDSYGYGLIDAKGVNLPGAKKFPPEIAILSLNDGSTFASIERDLIFLTDEECDWAAYSLNGGENVTIIGDGTGSTFIKGNATFNAEIGSNNLVLYCRNLNGIIGIQETNFIFDDTILYRFVQLTDAHIDTIIPIDYGAKVVTHSVEILEDSLKEIEYKYDPNTTIITGDLTDKGTLLDLNLSKNVFNKNSDNWYAVSGNHDVLLNSNFFPTVFNYDKWHFIDEISNSLFIGIDSNREHFVEGNVSEDQLTFLQEQLENHAGKDKIAFIFMHHTLHDVEDSTIRNADKVNDVIWSYTDDYRKIVQLCGHVHLNSRGDKNGVTYLTTCGIVSYPMEYRVIDVRSDSIDVSMGGPAHPEYSWLSLVEKNWSVLDDLGTEFDRNLHIDLSDKPPLSASFIFLPEDPFVDQEISFDASKSSDIHTITNYEWDFGDDDIINTKEAEITHSYSLPGSYLITLTVTNEHGETDSTSTTVTIVDSSPETVYRIHLTPNPKRVLSDNVSTSTITAQLKDIKGNNVSCEGISIEFKTTKGIISDTSALTDENGSTTVTLRANRPGVAIVRGSSDYAKLSGSTRVLFRIIE
ncbi:MAG: S8 family serine peptidase, partial [Halobacteriota archaeon]|nr:S8 family serine peptidase [Halobacteriota archaeon]